MTRNLTPITPRCALLSRLRLLLLCAAGLPLLSGCAWLCSFCAGTGTTTTPPKQVAAVVLDAQSTPPRVVVFPDPIRYRLADGPGAVEWRLPSGAGLRFAPQAAISFQDKDRGTKQFVECRIIGEEAIVFRCQNLATEAGRFKYDISVVPVLGPLQGRTITTDPMVVNEL
jgi:hypothetical protein